MKTLLIDTNILLRYLIADIPEQFIQTKKTIKQIEEDRLKAKISILVVNELIWILENYYDLERKTYIPQLLKLFALKNLKIVEVKKSLLEEILRKMLKTNLDFTDIYLAKIKNNQTLLTFDKKLLKIISSV